MSLIAQRLHLRAFLEGIEIPVISAVVQMTINAPAAASINVIPLDEVMELKPRTMVHLFFYDYTIDEPVDLDDFKRYRLLFIGETVGFQWVKTATGRSCVLQVADLSTNWDLAYQYMITYGPNGNFITEESANWAGENAIFNNIVDGHAAVLSQYLERTPKTPGLKGIKGLLGGIISLIETLGGVVNHSVGVNDYFTFMELKNRTLQQIAAEEDDNTAIQLFQSKEFYEWLERGLTSLGELCTIRDMIKLLFRYIYYEVVPNTCAYYIPGDGQKERVETEADRINKQLNQIYTALNRSFSDNKTLYTQAVDANKMVLTLLGNIKLTSTKQKNEVNKANLFLSAVTLDAATAKAFNSNKKNIKSAANAIKRAIDKKKLNTNINKVKLDKLNTFIFRPECYFVAPPRCNVIFPEHETSFSYDRSYVNEPTRLRLQSGMQFIGNDKLLAEYAYAPALKDIRAYAKEKSNSSSLRTLLPWEQFTGIQPKFEYVNEVNYIANKKQRELQKNIVGQAISFKQKAANFNFFKYRFAARSSSVSMKFNPFLVCGFPAVVIDKPFIIDNDTLADLIFANKGKGTPLDLMNGGNTENEIVGNINFIIKNVPAPTQFLGMVQSITHSLDSSSGGSTMITLSHSRTHKITEDDFLINLQQQKSKEAEKFNDYTLLDAKTLLGSGDRTMLKFLIDATPQDAKPNQTKPITKVVKRPQLKVDGLNITAPDFSTKKDIGELESELQSITTEDGKTYIAPTKFGKLKPGSRPGPKGGTIKYIEVLDGTLVRIPSSGTELVRAKAEDGSSDPIAWTSIMIVEEVTSSRTKLLPIEEILRPGWFSPHYSNLYIGDKIYNPYFGTGSITDQIVFSSPNGLSIQGVGAERDALFKVLDNSADESSLLDKVSRLKQTHLYNVPDVETAVNVLAYQYGEIRRQGLDVHKFINDYTFRPIATLVDIFGTSDLEYEESNNKLKIKSGTPGFHSSSIAPFGNLLGLVDNPDIELPRSNENKSSRVPRYIDKRPERRKQVEKYVAKLRGDGEVIPLQG